MEKCNHCLSRENLSIDRTASRERDDTLYICKNCSNRFKEALRKKLELSKSAPKKVKKTPILHINSKVKEYLCNYKCKECNAMGILERDGGNIAPVKEKIIKTVDLDDSGIKAIYTTWKDTFCRDCLNKRKKKKLDK